MFEALAADLLRPKLACIFGPVSVCLQYTADWSAVCNCTLLPYRQRECSCSSWLRRCATVSTIVAAGGWRCHHASRNAALLSCFCSIGVAPPLLAPSGSSGNEIGVLVHLVLQSNEDLSVVLPSSSSLVTVALLPGFFKNVCNVLSTLWSCNSLAGRIWSCHLFTYMTVMTRATLMSPRQCGWGTALILIVLQRLCSSSQLLALKWQ